MDAFGKLSAGHNAAILFSAAMTTALLSAESLALDKDISNIVWPFGSLYKLIICAI